MEFISKEKQKICRIKTSNKTTKTNLVKVGTNLLVNKFSANSPQLAMTLGIVRRMESLIPIRLAEGYLLSEALWGAFGGCLHALCTSYSFFVVEIQFFYCTIIFRVR